MKLKDFYSNDLYTQLNNLIYLLIYFLKDIISL